MTALLVSVASVGVGVSLRSRLAPLLKLIIRAQYLLLSAPLAFLGGLLFHLQPMSVSTIVILQAGEISAILVGVWLYRRSGHSAIAFGAGSGNSGIWGIPLAIAFLNSSGVVFIAVYASFCVFEAALLTKLLRRHAPVDVTAKTALTDYAPMVALAAGLALQLIVGRPAVLLPYLRNFGLFTAVVGAAVIGLAAPLSRPRRQDFKAALRGLGLRFGFAFPLLLSVVLISGQQVPAIAWMLALAPCYANILTGAALYGYERREAAAVLLSTLALAVPLVPLALWLGRVY